MYDAIGIIISFIAVILRICLRFPIDKRGYCKVWNQFSDAGLVPLAFSRKWTFTVPAQITEIFGTIEFRLLGRTRPYILLLIICHRKQLFGNEL
jgi:hypothetical protein